jgi:hypothetical protein
MTGETWRQLFGDEAEHRLETLRRGTGAVMVAHLLANYSPDEAERYLVTKLEDGYVADAKTLAIIHEIVARKRSGADIADAVDKLMRRGEKLVERAHRPRSGATGALRLLMGGRRWRPLHHR